jgi:ribosome-binding protein aMBF1 (putative translation factor)
MVKNMKKFVHSVNLLSADRSDSIPVEDTDFYKEMQSNRIGNLLEGARLKAGMTQAELAEKLNVRQNMISD